jgi:hypothetical protein
MGEHVNEPFIKLLWGFEPPAPKRFDGCKRLIGNANWFQVKKID